MSHASGHAIEKAIPAKLNFLAIYNPSLGQTDETRLDQIVYYYNGTRKPAKRHDKDASSRLNEEENERLRHIGLAQGMVEFGKAFSQGKSVDSIETEKSRIILHELETGWWILASIDLTRLPKSSKVSGSKDNAIDEAENIEYSSREVKPPVLLLQDLVRGHSIFLLHHAPSMKALFAAQPPKKFTSILGRYWDQFLSTWNVMLHGNPATAVYNGIKIASSGELGMGVGEEDRGSGEREVLEGFVGRIDGLVDLIVSRFVPATTDTEMPKIAISPKALPHLPPSQPWLGTGLEPGPDDGAIFLGVGALSKESLRDVTHWIEDIYSWGPHAYGIKDSTSRTRRKHPKGRLSAKSPDSGSAHSQWTKARIEGARSSAISKHPVRVNDDEEITSVPAKRVSSPVCDDPNNKPSVEIPDPPPVVETEFRENQSSSSSKRDRSESSVQGGKSGTFVDYLKLGYGTHWSLGGGTITSQNTSTQNGTEPRTIAYGEESVVASRGNQTPSIDTPKILIDSVPYLTNDSAGRYLVGLIGDIDADDLDNSNSDSPEAHTANARASLRTIHVELDRESHITPDGGLSIDLSTTTQEVQLSMDGRSPQSNASDRPQLNDERKDRRQLRAVVYANKPFIFTLLFEVSTASLTESDVYRSLHYQLAPLQRPLLASTSRNLPRPKLNPALAGNTKSPVYDLMWDPKQLTVFSTIPDIPSHHMSLNNSSVWSRLEALNTHMQILNTFGATRNESSELEQTCKTTRGYWVVWTRVPDVGATQKRMLKSEGTSTPVEEDGTTNTLPPPASGHDSDQESDTAHSLSQDSQPFDKIDRVRDKEIFLVRKSSDSTSANAFSRDNVNSPAKLAQGIGVDTKRYIDGLLDMYR